MIKKIFIFLFISLISINLSANEPLLDSAESSYASSNFETAVQHYQSILKKGLSSPDIYYNLGNCYFRSGELGNAILYYEKALKMDPSHENSAFNLTLAKTKRIDKFDEVPQFSFDVVLIGFILNSTVLADADKASVKEEDQSVFIKYPPVPESPFKANPDLS